MRHVKSLEESLRQSAAASRTSVPHGLAQESEDPCADSEGWVLVPAEQPLTQAQAHPGHTAGASIPTQAAASGADFPSAPALGYTLSEAEAELEGSWDVGALLGETVPGQPIPQPAPTIPHSTRQQAQADLSRARGLLQNCGSDAYKTRTAAEAFGAILRQYGTGLRAVFSEHTWSDIEALAERALAAAEAAAAANVVPVADPAALPALPTLPSLPDVPGACGGALSPNSTLASMPSIPSTSAVPSLPPSAQAGAGSPPPSAQASIHTSGGAALSQREREVLRATSTVHGVTFPPWDAVQDAGDAARFPPGWVPAFPPQIDGMFKDPCGDLRLSASQRRRFSRWARLHEITAALPGKGKRPCIIGPGGVQPEAVTQTSIGDCSVVSSLAIAALHEQRHGSRLISGIIYPHDSNGQPVYSPYGRYLVCLHFNGCRRRVEIDDRLPVDAACRPLCAFSARSTEFWPCLLEKAYMKLASGGYDFPGSNSAIDMHTFTGWIPDSNVLPGGEDPVDPERLWARLLSASRYGDVLATVSTGSMSEAEAETKGLVPTHAYAILDVFELPASLAKPSVVQGGHLRLVKVKNPWANTAWKGRFSPRDTANWTPQLQAAVGYDPGKAAMSDDGIFFIDFPALLHAFSRVYMNWNAGLFRHRFVQHTAWPAAAPGPANDLYTMGSNPQYALKVSVAPRSATTGAKEYMSEVWVVLTRHVQRRDAAEENASAGLAARGEAPEESDVPFLSLYAFKTQSTKAGGQKSVETHTSGMGDGQVEWVTQHSVLGGHRVHWASEAWRKTKYTPNPHVLLHLRLPVGEHDLTLVVSQYLRKVDVYYTLRVWSFDPVSLGPARHLTTRPLPSITGVWAGSAAGGNPSTGAAYWGNPQVALFVPYTSPLELQLQTQKTASPGIHLYRCRECTAQGVAPEQRISPETKRDFDLVSSTGPYRTCFNAATLQRALPGWYVAVLSTYLPAPGATFIFKASMSPASDLSLPTQSIAASPLAKMLPDISTAAADPQPGDSDGKG